MPRHRVAPTFGTVVRHPGGGGRVLTEAEAFALLADEDRRQAEAKAADDHARVVQVSAEQETQLGLAWERADGWRGEDVLPEYRLDETR